MIFTSSDQRRRRLTCFLASAAYMGLADATDAPIHLGITEAAGMISGTVEIRDWLGEPFVDGHWRYDPRVAIGLTRCKRSRSATERS